MVRHNNSIPNGHFHKNWQGYLKTWFDQPMKKRRRARKRKEKLNRNLPMPAERLRPMVHCPTVRYHCRIKPGRGFSLLELKNAGLNKYFAQTIGIAVDKRRTNKSVEAMRLNVQRLKEYRCKLVLFSSNKKKQKKEMPIKTVTSGINERTAPSMKGKARVPSEEEKKFAAYTCIQKARADAKYFGVRLKRKKMKTDNIEPVLMKGRRRTQDD